MNSSRPEPVARPGYELRLLEHSGAELMVKGARDRAAQRRWSTRAARRPPRDRKPCAPCSAALGETPKRLLVSSSIDEEGAHRARQEHDIQPHRPIAHVIDVHLDPLAEGSVVAARNLPQARYPRRYAQDLTPRLTYVVGLAEQVGTRADQAHLPAQDV